MSKAVFCSLFAIGLALGLGLRLARLDLRPMHHDEANEAVKFGNLLETGEYRYDRNDHHGPTLYYLTLSASWIRGQTTLSSLDEGTVRIVPAIFGGGLALLFCLFIRELGRTAVVIAVFLASLSPALTYYSRFYIQESLLTFFTIGFLVALGKYVVSPGISWALWAGGFAGLALATKETSIVLIAAAAVACFLARWSENKPETVQAGLRAASVTFEDSRQCPEKLTSFLSTRSVQVLAAVVAALLVACVFYSSFFKYPSDMFEPVRAFRIYFERAIDPGVHRQPWSFYLRILAFTRSGGLIWTEGIILGLALAGVAAGFRTARFGAGIKISASAAFWLRYIGCYSLLAALVFSLIRYKTPWNMIQFHAGFILMAGGGASWLIQRSKTRIGQALIVVGLLIACCHLVLQNWRANQRYSADPRNPYVYAQTSPDFLKLMRRIDDLAALRGDGHSMMIKVIADPVEQWPLPWYLRNMRRVGYWTNANQAGRLDSVPVLVASRENAGVLDAALGNRYVSEFYGLRPGVLLALFIERSLWEQFLDSSLQ
jgi:uncharacterized protein (TIGR03663 family)